MSAAGVSGKRALVTGASGFIGTCLCTRLLEEGVDVHGVSRIEQPAGDIRWAVLDLRHPEATQALIRDTRPDLIFHLASHVSGSRGLDAVQQTFNDNLVTTVNVLVGAAGSGCDRLVLVGSLEEPDNDEPEPTPVSPYSASKFAASAYGRMFHRLYDLPVANLRVFMTYGPKQRDTTKLVPYVITSLLRGEAPALSSGTRCVDWVYVDDVVAALLAAGTHNAIVGRTADVGSGVLTPIRTVVEEIASIMGSSIDPAFGALSDRPNERTRVADIARAGELLEWRPQMPLSDGLATTIEWFASKEEHR